MKKKIGRIAVAALLVLALSMSLAACGSNSGSGGAGGGDSSSATIRIGSKDFTESMVVAEIYALALEDAGYTVERKFAIAGSLVHEAITNNEIDLYPEYTGTGLLAWLKMDLITDPMEVYETVKAAYDEQFGITWLDFSSANDGQGLVIRTEAAKQYGIYTISDLQKHATELRFCSQFEFDEREDGIPLLEKTYGPFAWKEMKAFANGIKYDVLRNNEADVAPAYTTEGELVNTDVFTLLEDDKYVWPPYNLVPIVRNEVLEANPGIADALNNVSQNLDTPTLTMLNAEVDVNKREVDEVAADFFSSI